MPPAADDPPSDRVSADLPIGPSADAAPGAPPSVASEPEGRSEASPGEQLRRRRRRRRRSPPLDAVPAVGSDPAAISADEAPSGAEATVVDPGGDDSGAAEAGPTPGTAAHTTGDRPPRRRRRRRRPPPGGLGSALPRDDRGATTQNAAGDGSQPESTANGEAGAAAATPYGAGGTTGYLRLPVRRRRRLPRPPGLQRGMADVAPPNGETPAGDTAASAPRAEGEFPPRRRRRRPPLRIGEAVPASQDQSADGARRDAPRPPHGRGPNRRPGEERSRDGQPERFGEQQHRERGPGLSDADSRDRERGDRNDRGARGRGPGGPSDGQRRRGRDAPARRVEQKLYTLRIDGRSRLRGCLRRGRG